MNFGQAIMVARLAINLAGVLTLFRYGMPYRVETGGSSFLLLEETDRDAIREEARYRKLGFVGLALIVVGTALQIAATLIL